MSVWKRLFGPRLDDRAALRPLWQRIVAIAREPGWYAKGGIADTVEGRFDAITLVLALVMLRIERETDGRRQTALLGELFVEDIEGQLRQTGIGDPGVGKRMGRLMSTLGGRIGALRDSLGHDSDASLIAAIERNVTFGESPQPGLIAADLRAIWNQLDVVAIERLMAGDLPR